MDRKTYRKVLGKKLKDFRVEKGISAYKVAKKGEIQISQVTAVEKGETNYTIDVFLSYLAGIDLYMYFAEKEEKESKIHDFESLIKKAKIQTKSNN